MKVTRLYPRVHDRSPERGGPYLVLEPYPEGGLVRWTNHLVAICDLQDQLKQECFDHARTRAQLRDAEKRNADLEAHLLQLEQSYYTLKNSIDCDADTEEIEG